MLDDKQKANMATATSEESGTLSLLFSNYCNSLEQTARARYKEKCKECGFDPYTLKPSDFVTDWNTLPEVEYPDIANYLVLQTSWITKEQVKAYKSLEAYNFFVSGWVSNLLTKTAKDGRVVYTRVGPFLFIIVKHLFNINMFYHITGNIKNFGSPV